MNYKLNNVEVTKEELQKLIKKNPELLEENKGRGVPKGDEIYYIASLMGSVHGDLWANHKEDKFRLSQGNVFKTESEAKNHLEYLKAVAVIKEDAEGGVPDGKDEEQDKHYGIYDYDKKKEVDGDIEVYHQTQGVIYFKSFEAVEKSQEIHKKEGLLMFGIKE